MRWVNQQYSSMMNLNLIGPPVNSDSYVPPNAEIHHHSNFMMTLNASGHPTPMNPEPFVTPNAETHHHSNFMMTLNASGHPTPVNPEPVVPPNAEIHHPESFVTLNAETHHHSADNSLGPETIPNMDRIIIKPVKQHVLEENDYSIHS